MPGKSTSRLSKVTTDHDEIRQWAQSRGGKPSTVKRTGGRGDPGILRIDFPGYSGGKSLKEISWDQFFDKFDQQKLALVYQEKTAGGKQSNFNKLVSRATVQQKQKRSRPAAKRHGRAAR